MTARERSARRIMYGNMLKALGDVTLDHDRLIGNYYTSTWSTEAGEYKFRAKCKNIFSNKEKVIIEIVFS